MSSTNQFDWVDFYKELASKLLQYKDNRQELVENVRKIYEITGINLPTLERDNQIVDIDPFTFFGLFNKSSMKEDNRIKIISAVAKLFYVTVPVPTSFDSIPVLNNLNATFYEFVGDREDSDIDDLWSLFESALAYATSPTTDNRTKLSKYFDLTINKKGNGNSKITMGMYWIAPNAFLNLDLRNTWYIYKSGKIPADLVQTLPTVESRIPSSKYFDIVEKLRAYLQSDESALKDFKKLSSEAWRYSEEVNKENRAKKVQAERETKGAALADEDVETIHYWIYSPGDGATIWDECYNNGIMAIGWDPIGDLSAYISKDEMKQAMKEKIDPFKPYKNDAHATWQFANEMKPGFETNVFTEYQKSCDSKKFESLIKCVKELNTEIAADESLGDGFCIGHSYFCNLDKATDQTLSGIVEFELIPLLKEYWFDDPVNVKKWSNNLRSAIK